MFFEFLHNLYIALTRVLGLLFGENHIIVEIILYCDRWTDGLAELTHGKIYKLS